MRIRIIIALILSANFIFSQNYMDKIAKESCKCLDNMPDGLNTK